MSSNKVGFVFSFFLLLMLGACSQEQVPTPLPIAVLPTTPPPTGVVLPPTVDLSSTTIAPSPTALIATATATPTHTATMAPVNPAINITSPEANADLIMGSDIIVRGRSQLILGQTIRLSLVTLNGHLLAETQAAVGDVGWQSGLTVPLSVSGTAILLATIREQNGGIVAQNEIPVHLVLDTEITDRYLALFRPNMGVSAQAGFNLFFDGHVQRPVNNVITISVWSDSCQTETAKQRFVLNGSGYWQGFLIIPNTVSGPGCAIANFGTPGEETWREAHIPIHIFANDDRDAKGVVIGNPPQGSGIDAGKQFLLYGTAINSSEGRVHVDVLLENGRILSQNDVVSDYWGYWELPIILPIDVAGPAEITAYTGDLGADNYTEARLLITIIPAPTATP